MFLQINAKKFALHKMNNRDCFVVRDNSKEIVKRICEEMSD